MGCRKNDDDNGEEAAQRRRGKNAEKGNGSRDVTHSISCFHGPRVSQFSSHFSSLFPIFAGGLPASGGRLGRGGKFFLRSALTSSSSRRHLVFIFHGEENGTLELN